MYDDEDYGNFACKRERERRFEGGYSTLGEWAAKHNAKIEARQQAAEYEKWKEKREMERKYLKGFYLKKKEGKFGAFLKGSIKMPDFSANQPNEKGYINFCIFETKEGKPYAVLDDYNENKDKIIEFEVVKEDEIPF